MPPKGELSAKHQRFVDLYLVSLNATEAYKGAYGAADKVAGANGARLLKDARISAAIAARQQDRAERTEVDQDYVVRNLTEVVERCMERAPVMVRDPLDGRKWVQKQDDEGRNVWQFDATGAVKALTLLAKHTGGFSEKHDHRFPDGVPVGGVLAVPVPVSAEQWGAAAAAQQSALATKPPKATPLVS